MFLGHPILLVLLSQRQLILLSFPGIISFLNLKCRSALGSVLRPPPPLLSALTPYLISWIFNNQTCATNAQHFISGHYSEFQTRTLNWEVNLPTWVSTRHLRLNTFKAKWFISVFWISYLSKWQPQSPSCSAEKIHSPQLTFFFIYPTFDPSGNYVVSTIQIDPWLDPPFPLLTL